VAGFCRSARVAMSKWWKGLYGIQCNRFKAGRQYEVVGCSSRCAFFSASIF